MSELECKIALAEVFGYQMTAMFGLTQNIYKAGSAEYFAFEQGRSNFWQMFNDHR